MKIFFISSTQLLLRWILTLTADTITIFSLAKKPKLHER